MFICVIEHVYVSCKVQDTYALFRIITVCVEVCVYECVHTEHTAYITVLSSLARVLNHTLIVLFAAMLTRSLL